MNVSKYYCYYIEYRKKNIKPNLEVSNQKLYALLVWKIYSDLRYNLREMKTEKVVFKYSIQYSNRKLSFDFPRANKLVVEYTSWLRHSRTFHAIVL